MEAQDAFTREGVSDMRLVRTISLIGLTLLAYEFILTSPSTVKLIWRSKKSIVKSIFLFNRYVSIAYISLDVFSLFHPLSHSVCFGIYICTNALNIVCLSNYHIVMLIRTWAIWRQKFAILLLLTVMLVLKAGSISVIAILALIHIHREGFPLAPVYHACITELPSYMWFIWVSSLGIESVLFALMMTSIRHYEIRCSSMAPFIRALYQGSILYFAIVVFSGAFNIFVLVVYHERPTRIALSLVLSLSLSNIAGQRLILDIRRSDLFSNYYHNRIRNRSVYDGTEEVASNAGVLTSIMFDIHDACQSPDDPAYIIDLSHNGSLREGVRGS